MAELRDDPGAVWPTAGIRRTLSRPRMSGSVDAQGCVRDIGGAHQAHDFTWLHQNIALPAGSRELTLDDHDASARRCPADDTWTAKSPTDTPQPRSIQ
jgi:hypothetical protein